jgi:hypothetical protein
MPGEPPHTSSYLKPSDEQNQALLLSASYRDGTDTYHSPEHDISTFLLKDLSVARLNKIHSLLWIAGVPLPPRSLNFQLSISREIVPDERADMHLVWTRSRRIHLKPLPRYLLDHRFWQRHIAISHGSSSGTLSSSSFRQKQEPEGNVTAQQPTLPRADIYSNALGFLYSYIALIQYESDFAIAKEYRLVPETLKWETWLLIVQQALARGVNDPRKFNPRYQFGELRLSRLDLICRLHQGAWLHGYEAQFQSYGEFFQAYLAPVTIATIYVALVLTAMQVGLATDRLGQSEMFRSASYGLTVFGILAPLGILVLLLMLALVAFVVNAVRALNWRNRRLRFYDGFKSMS